MADRNTSKAWLGLAVGLTIAIAGCRAGTSPAPPAGTPTPSPMSPVASSVLTSSPGALAMPTPGRPYSAEDILLAMQNSRRPGGVPDELETSAIAASVALNIWTFDGRPWSSLTAGGSCGPARCTLEISGAPAGAEAEDLYLLSVATATGEVSVDSAELRGLSAAVLDDVDGFARSRWPDAPIPGPLVTGRWLPPPDDGVFVLSYRSGGEEQSPALDLRVDITTGAVELVPLD